MSQVYGQATGNKKARGDKFMALSIFAVQVQPELKGNKSKSWVCSVSGYGQPTVENWQGYFVGYQEELKIKILADFEAWADFGNPERENKAQPTPNAQPQDTYEYHSISNYEEFENGLPDVDEF